MNGREKLQKHFDGAVESVRQIRISTDKVTEKGRRHRKRRPGSTGNGHR